MKLVQKIFCASALVGSLMATNAYADAVHEGFDTRLVASALILAESGPGSGGLIGAGINGTISLGYRFHQNVGVYVDQDLGGVWFTSGTNEYDDEESSSAIFRGGSFAVVRGIFGAYYDDIEFSIGGGPGAMYGGGITACFAIKLSATFTYYITENIGVGINVDYNLGFIKPEDEFEIEMLLVHHINPGLLLHVNF